MKSSKNNRTIILVVVLLGLLILAYKLMFAPASDVTGNENVSTMTRVDAMFKQVENINFDTSVIENTNFKSLKSIEIPLSSLPVGRQNPFSVTSGSN